MTPDLTAELRKQVTPAEADLRARSASAVSSADRPRTVSCKAFSARRASAPRAATSRSTAATPSR